METTQARDGDEVLEDVGESGHAGADVEGLVNGREE